MFNSISVLENPLASDVLVLFCIYEGSMEGYRELFII